MELIDTITTMEVGKERVLGNPRKKRIFVVSYPVKLVVIKMTIRTVLPKITHNEYWLVLPLSLMGCVAIFLSLKNTFTFFIA